MNPREMERRIRDLDVQMTRRFNRLAHEVKQRLDEIEYSMVSRMDTVMDHMDKWCVVFATAKPNQQAAAPSPANSAHSASTDASPPQENPPPTPDYVATPEHNPGAAPPYDLPDIGAPPAPIYAAAYSNAAMYGAGALNEAVGAPGYAAGYSGIPQNPSYDDVSLHTPPTPAYSLLTLNTPPPYPNPHGMAMSRSSTSSSSTSSSASSRATGRVKSRGHRY